MFNITGTLAVLISHVHCLKVVMDFLSDHISNIYDFMHVTYIWYQNQHYGSVFDAEKCTDDASAPPLHVVDQN